jgi:uncharacterized protein (DUF2141 family)
MVLALLSAAQGLSAEQSNSSLVSASVDVTVHGIRSSKGVIRMVICPPNAKFPACDANAVRSTALTIDRGAAHAQFNGLSAGTYAIGVFHDANGNGKLDTFLGIPKEGYGFSRNPPFRPRAPRFDEAVISIDGRTQSSISLRYIL